MDEDAKRVTREELYEAVWAKPFRTLAQEWNTTYTRLAQACQEMEAPRPGAGHWTLIWHGLVIEKEPLPEGAGNIPQEGQGQRSAA